MLVADDAEAFARFCEVAGRDDLSGMPDEVLEAELVDLFLTRTAQEWERDLLAADVGCVVADDLSHFAFLFEDEQAKAIEMMTPVEHPSLGGRYWRYSPVFSLSDTPSQALPFTEHGEHTRALLAEAGYDSDAIADLEADGVVASLEMAATS
jgi:crotonobetainyl-CoA:carnitine CoA-transferase CaiB-like acyl-CoA transferase